jgi:endonuclease/exonuclease/phosphatase (EEP) superfamily protein YafD
MNSGGRTTGRRLVALTAWTVLAVAGILAVTQAAGWSGLRVVAVMQALTPYLGALVLPVVAVSLWQRRPLMTATGVAVGLGLLVLAAPLVFPGERPVPVADATELRIASGNLLYRNDRVGDVPDRLRAIDADVIVFVEYSTAHRETLEASPLAELYPYRVDRGGGEVGGAAVWSRTPVTVGPFPDTVNRGLDVTVAGPHGAVRILALHVPTPLVSLEGWHADLRTVARLTAETTAPTVVIGDLNASYWHPVFREVLDAGLTDAHMANARGFTTSWPTDRIVPPFVRLDHALTTDDLVATDVTDFDIPGSDHRGLVVTVVPARPAAP